MTPSTIRALDKGDSNRCEGDWPDRVLPSVTRPELHAYAVDRPKGRVVVCAGGGYTRLMLDKEGVEVALWLNGLGYEAHVLIHRLPGAPDGAGGVWPKDIARRDGLKALETLPDDGLPLFLCGLSSGGHLAGVLACHAAAAGLIVAYAPLNANHAAWKAPAGKPDFEPAEKQAFYNDWPIGIVAEPQGLPRCPVFIACALHDAAVPVEHALNLIRAGRDAGLEVDAHIFGQAPHGFALRHKDGSHALWPDLAADWLARRDGRR